MIRKLLNWCAWCAGATVPPPDSEKEAYADQPTPPRGCSHESEWYATWAHVIRGLSTRDGNQSGEFLYQALAMQIALGTLSFEQVHELLDSTLGAHVAAEALGHSCCLDCRRLVAMKFELHRRRQRLVVRPSSLLAIRLSQN